MLRWLRRTRVLSAALTVAVVLAWMGGLSAKLAHEITARHAVCEDHGQLVEDDGDADEHRHGCELAGLPSTGAAPELPGPPEDRLAAPAHPVVACWLARAHAPRGPPLAYAPKTSPPLPA